jgi:hypothetical protein
MRQFRIEDKSKYDTEEQTYFVKHVPPDEQKTASTVAADSSCQPCAFEAALATVGLARKLPEKCSAIDLLYDSFAQPARAGTRSAGMSVRQMLYRAEPYQIDIQLEAQPDRNCLIVTGQLLDLGHPDMVNVGTQVTLSDGRENNVNTVTNQFGEFRGEINHSGYLELSFLPRDGKSIVILLRGALDHPMSRGKN